ncbi:charged multivesicular body protein 3-like [Acanthaster planci]|uniref:Charged multivesicular body protein 3-like n=1 Tax=Acanthaster planci TaxID=133434 RepID=A0A8B7XIK1_ACAPL|nr:charged multivesicular body protein 3-like [Acanthaster planci]
MGLFGKTPQKDPKEQVQEWTRSLNRETRKLDRQIRSIEREEMKVKRSLKDAAKKGEKDVCKILAKEIVNSRKAVKRIHTSKAQINSVSMQMKNQLALIRMSGALQKSTDVMKIMSQLCRVQEVQATMMEMSKEMMKAGIIEEMVEDTFESLEDDEMEEATEQEVEKILFEITAGHLVDAPKAVNDDLPVAGATAISDEEPEEDISEMQARLEALRS